MRTSGVRLLGFATVLLAFAARAEKSAVNIHLDPGVGTGLDKAVLISGAALKVDTTLIKALGPLAPQLEVFGVSAVNQSYLDGGSAFGAGLGARLRLFNDEKGYFFNPGQSYHGNFAGNFWVDAHVTYTSGGMGVGFDVGTGYEFSLVEGMSVGPFAKFTLNTQHQNLLFGVSFTIGAPDRVPDEADYDGDGVLGSDDGCPTEAGPASNKGCPDQDQDHDGVLGAADRCPTVAEDKDGFQDDDGCPDLDDDADGVPDVDDACRTLPGPKENKGCPDQDEDHDGVMGAADACPKEKGPAENKGCPDQDRDGDTVPDRADKCVEVPGDKNNDGCPWPDQDGDGVVDRFDNCPKEAGPVTNSGCPTRVKQLVQITSDKLVIKEKVFFEIGKAVLQPKSNVLLDQVAAVLKDHTEIKLVQVEGHTDNTGDAETLFGEERRRRGPNSRQGLRPRPAGRHERNARGSRQQPPRRIQLAQRRMSALPTVAKTAGHAVVLGGGIGGLYHAAVLRRHFERVTVLESDVISMTEVGHRPGAAQDQQLHGLLKRGWDIFEKYLPGLTARLTDAGARVAEFGLDVRWYMNGTWWSPKPTGFHGLGFTRPFFEFHMRARLLEEPNVVWRGGARVRGLSASRPGVVDRVDFEVLATGQTETLEADLVVDCTGRNSKAAAWLGQLGFQAPEAEEVDVGITYVTQLVRLAADPGWTTCYVGAEPPHQKRFGMILGAQNGLSVFLVGSYLGERPPVTSDGMADFAQTLSQPLLADVVRSAERLSQPTPYHFKSNLRRAYSRAAALPARLLISGDATCSFNPIYGQGMTSAGLAAEVLDDLLTRGVPLDRLAKVFQHRLDRVLDQPWLAALANDLQFPQVQGRRSPLLSFTAAYSRSVLRAMHHNAVQKRFLPVLNMTVGPLAFFHPTLVGAALLTAVGAVRPNPTFPGRREPHRPLGAGPAALPANQ